MNSSIYKWLILVSFAATWLMWAFGALDAQSAQANDEYRTCVQLVSSHSLSGTVDGCKSERDLLRALH